ncbi:hypothetical protein N598_14915 [Klebsiella pneumoniae 303K]|nr:hypothetical protein N598_14915 [Klebsiella pneumoniae 303K]
MLAERGGNVDHSRFTAGFSVMRLKWKNRLRCYWLTLPIFARTWMKLREVNGRSVSDTGPSTAGAAL